MQTDAARSLVVLSTVLLLPLGTRAAAQAPTINSPLAVVHLAQSGTNVIQQSVIEITGHGFGAAAVGTFTPTLAINMPGTSLLYLSSAPEIKAWQDGRIVVQVARNITKPATVIVSSATGSTPKAVDNSYSLTLYDMPVDGGTGHVAVDQHDRAWVNNEFHHNLYMVDPNNASVPVQTILIPTIPSLDAQGQPNDDAFPFMTVGFGPVHRTNTSDNGEDITVDKLGRVWFPFGGPNGYKPTSPSFPNRSRIVRYDPAAGSFTVFNLPGDNNAVTGIALTSDPVTNEVTRVWYTTPTHPSETYQDGTGAYVKELPPPPATVFPAAVVSFDPSAACDPSRDPVAAGICTDGTTFDLTAALNAAVCPSGVTNDANCFHQYPLPGDTTWPAHLAVDGSGIVWAAQYYPGNNVIRLDPSTGTSALYPLPAPVTSGAQFLFFGSAPWHVVTGANGDIAFTEFADASVGRVRSAMKGSASCLTLGTNGQNPCIDEQVLPFADFAVSRAGVADYDASGNLWFTQGTQAPLPGRLVDIGYVTADWSKVVSLPPLTLFPGPNANTGGVGALAVDKGTSDVWATEYLQHRVLQLHKD